MKIKLLVRVTTILLLLCAIFVSCLSGTLSAYTANSSNNVKVAPDTEKIMANLVPDTAAINEECIVNGITVKKNTDISNDEYFVLFSGNITQKTARTLLTFGAWFWFQDTYLLYFEPGTNIRLSDGTSIPMCGFYTIRSGLFAVNIFDKSLYQQTASGYVLKGDNPDFQVCSDVISTCKQFGIPLKYNS